MIHHRRLLSLVILASCSVQQRADAFAGCAGFRIRTVVKNRRLPHPFSEWRPSAAVQGRSALVLEERQLRKSLRPLFGKDSENLETEQEGELETVYIDTSQDEVPEDVQAELVDNQPSEWAIMKEILGINVVTYVLAIAIAFFFSMNALLGPGWLGSTIGLPGTGTFTEKSESLPDTFDLSDDAYLL